MILFPVLLTGLYLASIDTPFSLSVNSSMEIYLGILYIMYGFCILFGDPCVPALIAFLTLGPNYDLYIDSIFLYSTFWMLWVMQIDPIQITPRSTHRLRNLL